MEKGHTDQSQGSDIAGKGKTMIHWIEEDAALNTFASFQRLCVEALVPRVTLYGGGGALLNIFSTGCVTYGTVLFQPLLLTLFGFSVMS